MSGLPPEVTAASERLRERSLLEDRSKIPELFREIIKNQTERAQILARGPSMTQDDWRRLKELNLDMRQSLRPGAEQFLRHNTDKGNTP